MVFDWNDAKNNTLKNERGIGFERIIVAIEEGYLLGILEHSNPQKYPDQILLVVEIDNYAMCVPCVVKDDDTFFLKTIFPSRKYTRFYKLRGEENEKN